MRKKVVKIATLLMMVLALFCIRQVQVNAGTLTASSDPINLMNKFMGRYEFNYTGNTNHFDWWNDEGEFKLVERNFTDRLDITSENNSTGTLKKGASDARIARAFLVWQTRSKSGVNTPIRFYTPTSGTRGYEVSAQYACVDTRSAPNGSWTYNSLYCMATDVTEVVKAAGYGKYTVANIPVWENEEGTRTGGESVASWQLIIVEESEDYEIRNITLNIASKFYMAQDFKLSMNSAVASKESGIVNGQIFYGTSNSGQDVMTENYETYDVNGNLVGSGVSNQTSQAGLYKNGVAFNTRDQGVRNGSIRMSLSDITDIGNDVTKLRMSVENTGWTTTFVMGMGYDINMYTVSYDGNGAQGGWTERTSCLFDKTYTINENGFSYKYHKFLGWNTEADGSGTWWYPGDTYKNLCTTSGADYKLYAQWETLGAMITLDNQGADIKTGTPKYFEKYNDRNYTDDDCQTPIDIIVIPEKSGYVFDGYYTEKNGGGTMYVDPDGNILSTSTTFKDDTTLYAKWIPGVYKITLDNQGADIETGTPCYYEKYSVGNYADEECTTEISQIEIPKKTGYTFNGYWTKTGGDDGGGSLCITAEGKICAPNTQFTEDTTIYADWEPEIYKITLDNQNATNAGSTCFYEKYATCFYYDKITITSGTKNVAFNYTGKVQYFVAPYTGTYTFKAYGAQGGSYGATGGKGAYAQGQIKLTQGDVVYVYVGGQGSLSGGWNGGGKGSSGFPYYAGGGGATDFRLAGTSYSDRVLVAAGGGGSTYLPGTGIDGINGSAGGGTTGGIPYRIWYGAGNSYNGSDKVEYNEVYAGTAVTQSGTNPGSNMANKVDTSLVPGLNKIAGGKAGGFGYGGVNCGAGWYGGTEYYHDFSNIGSFNGTSIMYFGGWGGSSYTGGMMPGTTSMTAGTRSGNGYAVISRSNYTTELVETTKIVPPTKPGYYFKGYYTGKNGTGTAVTDSEGNIIVDTDFFTSDSTVYAYWSTTNTSNYTIRFHGNGETGGSMADMLCTYGKTYTLSALAYEKEGYHFVKWTTNQDGSGQAFTDQQSVSNLSSVDGAIIHLYAQWEANSYTLVFHPNDGAEVIPISNMTVSYDDVITLPDVVLPDDTDAYVKYTLDGENITDQVLSQAIVLAMDGTVVYQGEPLPDGCSVAADGTIMYPDGTIVNPDGTIENSTEDSEEESEVEPGASGDSDDEAAPEEPDASGDSDDDDEAAPEEPDASGDSDNDEAALEEPDASGDDGQDLPVEEDGNADEQTTASIKKKDVSVVAEPETDSTEPAEDEEPQPDKKAYKSVFMGWSLEDEKDDFVPQWTIEELSVSDIIDAAGVANQDGATITLYAVWDDCPWIIARHLYYTLEQAQSGFITEEEILSHATALDREDGSPIEPGEHDNGTSFTIPDYATTDFTQFQHEGSCTENLTVVDSVGSIYVKQITVHVVDTTAVAVEPEGTTRFIDEYYYGQPYENGGLEENSIWLTDSEYVSTIQETFDNIRNDDAIMTYYLTHEEILDLKQSVLCNETKE